MLYLQIYFEKEKENIKIDSMKNNFFIDKI